MAWNRVVLSGTLLGAEDWACGISFIGDAGEVVTDYTELEGWATTALAYVEGQTFPTSLMTMLSTQGTIDTVRVEAHDSTGALTQAAEVSPVTPKAGTGTPNKSIQTTVVCSIRTGRPGRSYRGRIYWPALNLTLETASGRISNSAVSSASTGFAQMLTTLGTSYTGSHTPRPAVASRTIGQVTRATSVDVGDVPDVMRRRRDSLPEARVVTWLPA